MAYKFMRVAVFFDLPTSSKKERRMATRFRNFLLKDGFNMLQYSVYTRLCPNRDATEKHMNRVKRNAPDVGSIRLIYLTEHQFTNMYVITGKKTVQERCVSNDQLSFF